MKANESRRGEKKKRKRPRLCEAGPRRAVNQAPHQQRCREQDIGRAEPNGFINPINPRHMHPRGSAPKPASIIIVLRYYHYSVFPLCGFAFNPLIGGKNVKKKEKLKRKKSYSARERERGKQTFSHRALQPEDVLSGTDGRPQSRPRVQSCSGCGEWARDENCSL